MVATHKLKGILSTLALDGVLHVPFDGLEVLIQRSADLSNVRMSAHVFTGDHYIPKSVRKCIRGRGPCAGYNPISFVTVDEAHCRIDLNCDYPLKDVTEEHFIEMLEQFGWQVEEWRHFIDRHGEGDLVYINVKP
jgi:hypothetical protein